MAKQLKHQYRKKWKMSTRNKLVLPKKLEENIRKQQEDNLAGVINRYIEEIKIEETKTKSFIFYFSIVCK